MNCIKEIATIAEIGCEFRDVDRSDWLSPAELTLLEAGQRIGPLDQWLAGRWFAKRLISERKTFNGVGLSEIHIESLNGRGRKTRPQVYVSGKLVPLSLTISHADRWIAAAITPLDWQVGIDIVCGDRLPNSFRAQWFCRNESSVHETEWSDRMIWSLKEAWYKAANNGEAFYPRRWDTTELLPATAWEQIESEIEFVGRFETTSPGDRHWIEFCQNSEALCTLVRCRREDCQSVRRCA